MKWILTMACWLALGSHGGILMVGETKAQLVFFREKEFLGGSFPLKINGVLVTNWAPGRYFRVTIPPGKLHLSTLGTRVAGAEIQGHQVLDLEVQAGQTYYIKAFQIVDIYTSELHLKPVSEAKAKAEMRNLKPDNHAKTNL